VRLYARQPWEGTRAKAHPTLRRCPLSHRDADRFCSAIDTSLFFRLISYRYGRGAMVITTNKSIRDWTELLAGDEVLATAILDRLLHRSHVLNIKGRSYRLRDLEDALKT
jgi:hypothetical protein